MANKKADHEPPKGSAGDIAHAVVKAAIGSVPYAGGAAAEAFQLIFSPPIEKRKFAWMEDVAEAIRKLEAAGKTVAEDLASNPIFLDTMMHASQAAIRTSRAEKWEALRNAVSNAALPHAPDETRQQIFINFVDTLTVWHLRILRLFADPRAWYQSVNRKPPEWHITGSLSQLLTDAYPELAKEDKLNEKLFKDLYEAGLLSSSGFKTMMSGSGPLEPRATELGNQFLEFISAPDSDA
jgi:hypothetical protein